MVENLVVTYFACAGLVASLLYYGQLTTSHRAISFGCILLAPLALLAIGSAVTWKLYRGS